MSKRTLVTALTATGIGAALLLAAPVAASAHVTVDPAQAESGGWSYLTFRVPTESDTASTVKLEVHLPTDTPFTHVSYQPAPGWSTKVVTEKLPSPVDVSGNTISEAPTEIVYTADAAGIEPGQVQMFTVSLGPVPDTGHVVIPVTQSYSDGSVVEWKATPEELSKDDTLEPAPVLWVNDAPAADEHAGGVAATSEPPAAAEASGLPLGLSIAALVIAAGGALLGSLALARSRDRKVAA